MSQISYGTFTITDTTDIESIVLEYAISDSPLTVPFDGWDITRPTWIDGSYIWQRTRIHKSGEDISNDTFGIAVCVTGSNGSTGLAGRGLVSSNTEYTIAPEIDVITQENMSNYTWTSDVPEFQYYYGPTLDSYFQRGKEYLKFDETQTLKPFTVLIEYTLTSDTSVTANKPYYTYNSETESYNDVIIEEEDDDSEESEEEEINPHENGWYEILINPSEQNPVWYEKYNPKYWVRVTNSYVGSGIFTSLAGTLITSNIHDLLLSLNPNVDDDFYKSTNANGDITFNWGKIKSAWTTENLESLSDFSNDYPLLMMGEEIIPEANIFMYQLWNTVNSTETTETADSIQHTFSHEGTNYNLTFSKEGTGIDGEEIVGAGNIHIEYDNYTEYLIYTDTGITSALILANTVQSQAYDLANSLLDIRNDYEDFKEEEFKGLTDDVSELNKKTGQISEDLKSEVQKIENKYDIYEGFIEINPNAPYILLGKRDKDGNAYKTDELETGVRITASTLRFESGGKISAYASGQTFHAPEGVYQNIYMQTPKLDDYGNPTTDEDGNVVYSGTLGWIARSNGHLSLKPVTRNT